MLWPEGAQHRLAPLGSYVEPQLEGESVQSVSVSHAGAYMVVASERVLGLLRTKPLSPVALYPGLNPESVTYKSIAVSVNGGLVGALSSDNSVEIYAVQPTANLEEVLRTTATVVPGPGEAIGVREGYLSHIKRLELDFDVVAFVPVGPQAFAAVGPQHFQIWTPELEKYVAGTSILHTNESYIWATALDADTLGLSTSTGRFLVCTTAIDHSETNDKKPEPEEGPHNESSAITTSLAVEHVIAADYHPRVGAIAVATKSGAVMVSSTLGSEDIDAFVTLPLPSRKYTWIKWAPAGTCMALGHEKGWMMVSMVGTVLYESEATAPISQVEWSGDSLLFVEGGRVHQQPLLRLSQTNGTNGGRPVLIGSGRLMVYHDHPSVQASPWLTVPLPQWYVASNWPLGYAAASDDGRLVAVAGTSGVMYFSTVSRQWRQLNDSDAAVRGGIAWYGRRLITTTLTSGGNYAVKMFSPARASTNGGDTESEADAEQIVAYDNLGGGQPISLSLSNNLLGVLVAGSAPYLRLYSLARNDLELVRELPLAGVLPGVPRSVVVIDLRRVFFLIGSKIILLSLVTDGERNKYKRQTIAMSVDTYFYHSAEQLLWMWDGQEVLLRSLREDVEQPLPSKSTQANKTSNEAHNDETENGETQNGEVQNGEPQNGVTQNGEPQNDEPLQSTGGAINEESSRRESGANNEDPEAEESKYTKGSPENGWQNQREQGWKVLAQIPLDSYPVYVSPSKGVLALVESDPVKSFDGSFWAAKPATALEVYVPWLLEAALDEPERLRLLARRYMRLPYFDRVLDTLLYRAIVSRKSDQEVPAVIDLLSSEQFVQYKLDVVASCARKVEMTYWSRLFAALGAEPAQLFDECLASGALSTASEFLLVVQAHETGDAGGQRAQALYRAALAAKEFRICRELCEFLVAVDPSGDTLRSFAHQVLPVDSLKGVDISVD